MDTEPNEIEAGLQNLTLPSLFHTSDRWRELDLERVRSHLCQAYALYDDLCADLLRHVKHFKLMDKGQLILTLRSLRHSLDLILKCASSPTNVLELAMCQEIAAQDMYQVASMQHTFTAKTQAYLSKMPKPETPEFDQLQKWLTDSGHGELFAVQLDKKGLEGLSRELLEAGEEPPPGVGMYIRASIAIRKK